MSTPRYAHNGAGTSHRAPRLPRRLSPRRTSRLMGFRVRPETHTAMTGGFSIAAFIVTIFDFDNDPTEWTPVLFQALGM